MNRLRDWVVAAVVLLAGVRSHRDDPEGDGRIVSPGEPDRRAESWVLALLAVATLAAAAFVGVYALDPVSHRTQLLGLTLGVSLASIAAALVVVGGNLVVTEELAEPYPAARAHATEQEELAEIVVESGSRITRRRLLGLSAAAAGGTLGVALLAPVLSLGPMLDTASLAATPWRRGRRLVDSDGSPLRAEAIEQGAFYTAFPEGAREERLGAPLVVVRLDSAELALPRDRKNWAPGGIVAYSKICTHAGCAVALYRKPTFPAAEPRPAFVCPCHYSTFDPATGGTVLFGPAGRPLPQLPLEIDRAGNLRAAGPFSGRVGPAWWGVRL